MKIRIIIALSIVSLISIVYLLGFPILYRHYPRRKVSFTYDDTPIKVCLEDVVKQAGIEKIVYESTIDENSVITLRGRQMRGPNALHWISEIAELQIRYDGKYLHVGNTVQAGSDSNEFNNESFQKVYGDFDWYIFNKFGFHLY